MSKVNGRFWTADLHLGHAKVADIRGFASVRDHDTAIISQLAKLGPFAEVWVLGDISSGKREDEEAALELLGSHLVEPMLHLIAGNHDSVSSINKNGFKHQRRWLQTFDSVQQFGRVKLSGTDVLMSHFPFERSGDGPGRGPGRFNEFRLPNTGMPLIHGHTHHVRPHMIAARESWHKSLLDLQQFCVSWDAHRGLVSEHTLNQWIEGIK